MQPELSDDCVCQTYAEFGEGPIACSSIADDVQAYIDALAALPSQESPK